MPHSDEELNVPPPPPEERQFAPPADRVNPWTAALASAQIPYRVTYELGETQILVPESQAARALEELDAYEIANMGWPMPQRESLPLGPWELAWGCSLPPAAALVRFFFSTGDFDAKVGWFSRGMMSSARFAAGDWWRSVTALTLHADLSHVLGNAVCCVLFGAALGQLVGPGVGWLLILAGGVAGNVLAHFLGPVCRQSVGASTATFSALGTLTALQFYRLYRRYGSLRSVWARPWLPLVAGTAMLGFFGTSGRADIAAHGWGFAAGLALALPAVPLLAHRPRASTQFCCALTAVAVIALAWLKALG